MKREQKEGDQLKLVLMEVYQPIGKIYTQRIFKIVKILCIIL